MSRRRVALGLAVPVLLAGAFLASSCCALRPHHQRRLGADPCRDCYQEDKVLARGLAWNVLRFGPEEGGAPAVLLLHEIGGASPETLELGNRLQQEGYTVYV